MKLHRFIGDFAISGQSCTVTDLGLLHQWRNVLRFDQKDELYIVPPGGFDLHASIDELSMTEARLKIIERVVNDREPARTVTLCCAVLKRDNFSLIVEKSVEIGVARIVPLLTVRTEKEGLRLERLQTIAKEAAEQSGRAYAPTVSGPKPLKEALDNALSVGSVAVYDQTGEQSPSSIADPLSIFIGPEGGWAVEELELFRKKHIRILSLGKLTLRAETAAVVASYLAVHSP